MGHGLQPWMETSETSLYFFLLFYFSISFSFSVLLSLYFFFVFFSQSPIGLTVYIHFLPRRTLLSKDKALKYSNMSLACRFVSDYISWQRAASFMYTVPLAMLLACAFAAYFMPGLCQVFTGASGLPSCCSLTGELYPSHRKPLRPQQHALRFLDMGLSRLLNFKLSPVMGSSSLTRFLVLLLLSFFGIWLMLWFVWTFCRLQVSVHTRLGL